MVVGDVRARFHVSSRRELQRISALTGEKQLLVRVLGELREGDVVFDVGANIGTHAIAFAKTVGDAGRVAAFEPEPEGGGQPGWHGPGLEDLDDGEGFGLVPAVPAPPALRLVDGAHGSAP